MHPIIPAIALPAGLTATVFVLMQPAREVPQAIQIECVGDSGNPDTDAVRVGLVDGATDPVLNPWFASHRSIVAGGRGTAEGRER